MSGVAAGERLVVGATQRRLGWVGVATAHGIAPCSLLVLPLFTPVYMTRELAISMKRHQEKNIKKKRGHRST